MKYLFLYENKFSFLIKFINKSFFYTLHNIKNFDKKNFQIISPHIKNVIEHGKLVYLSGQLSKKFVKEISSNKFLANAHLQSTAMMILKILEINEYLNKIKLDRNISNIAACFYLENRKLLKFLYEEKYISKNFMIYPPYKFVSYMYNFLRNIYIYLRFLFLPIYFFLCSKGNDEKKNKRTGVILQNDFFHSIGKKNFSDFIFKRLKNCIYVVEFNSYNKKKFKLQTFYKNEILHINSILSKISKKSYIKNFLFQTYKEIFKSFISDPTPIVYKYKYFFSKFLWEIFFHYYSVKNFITIMKPTDQAGQEVIYSNVSNSVFVYLSSTPLFVSRVNRSDFNMTIQYNFMHYHTLMAPNSAISSLNCKTNRFDNIKPTINFYSSQAKRNTKSRKIFIKNFKITKSKNKNAVFFDNSITSKNYIFNYKEYTDFLKRIYTFAKNNKNLNVILVMKSRNFFQGYYSSKLNTYLNFLKKQNNFYLINNSSTETVLSIANLVFSQPLSSILYEAIESNLSTAVIDTRKSHHINNNYLSSKIENYLKLDDSFFKKKISNLDWQKIIFKSKRINKDFLNNIKKYSLKDLN